MQKFWFVLFLGVCLVSRQLNAQSKNIKSEAARFFEARNFKSAFDLYEKLSTENPTNLEYKFRLGYSALNYPDKKDRALEIFSDLKVVDKSPDIDYYLAKAYHINYRFNEAIENYNKFLASKSKNQDDEDAAFLIEDAKLGLENCNNGKELIEKKIIANIENIGPPINSEEMEGVPIISADESVMIYTYVGKKSTGGLLNDASKPDKAHGSYHEDIFISTRIKDSIYSEPLGIDALNTTGNDAAVAISPDGNTLFTFQSNSNEGDLYISSLSGSEWSKPELLNKNINSESWEGSCSISSDGRFLYFASERPGGYGGKDLYVSEKINGDWGAAKNLGPTINTKYNEDAPFIHADGISLFFSSEGHKSIGGYDIMYSINKDNKWIEPVSMGIPLNTTENDCYFVINAKGDRGYFSSNRSGAGGKGGQDIYTVYPGILGEKPVLALLKGSVFVDDKLTKAKIEVIKKTSNEEIGPYYSNSVTGKFLVALSPGSGYKIKISSIGSKSEPIEEEIDVEKLKKYLEIKKDFYIYTDDFKSKNNQVSAKSLLDTMMNNQTSNPYQFKADNPLALETSAPIDLNSPTPIKKADPIDLDSPTSTKIADTINPCNGYLNPSFASLKGKSLNDPAIYKKLIEIAGGICADGLIFKIQIAAYKKPENYKYDHLNEFGKPEVINYPDGITRFTQLQFKTLKDAEAARQKIIAKGQADAWITGLINGKRYTLEELIILDFFGKAVN